MVLDPVDCRATSTATEADVPIATSLDKDCIFRDQLSSPRTGRHRFEPYPTRQIEMPDIATGLAEASDTYRTGGIFDYVDYLLDLLERIANCFEVCIALAVETEDKIEKVRYEAHRIMCVGQRERMSG